MPLMAKFGGVERICDEKRLHSTLGYRPPLGDFSVYGELCPELLCQMKGLARELDECMRFHEGLAMCVDPYGPSNSDQSR